MKRNTGRKVRLRKLRITWQEGGGRGRIEQESVQWSGLGRGTREPRGALEYSIHIKESYNSSIYWPEDT